MPFILVLTNVYQMYIKKKVMRRHTPFWIQGGGARFTVYFQQYISYAYRFLARSRLQNDPMTTLYTLFMSTCRINHTFPKRSRYQSIFIKATEVCIERHGSPYKVRDVPNASECILDGKSREIVNWVKRGFLNWFTRRLTFHSMEWRQLIMFLHGNLKE